ncbi:MAG: peptide-methionine (R)-S-oxide reductase MsrB [Xanthobacteraceae bacterium]
MKPSPGRNAMKSNEEWRKQLTPEQFHVARQHGTERPLLQPAQQREASGHVQLRVLRRAALFVRRQVRFGTGWPSFSAPANEGTVSENEDRSWLMRRIEVRCAACDAHLGHVFPDGPKPTGLRYCMNGVALSFAPGATTEK